MIKIKVAQIIINKELIEEGKYIENINDKDIYPDKAGKMTGS